MIDVLLAQKLIQQNLRITPAHRVPLAACTGEYLREDILAEREHPPFDRVMMDGFAFNWETWKSGRRDFIIEGCQPAGEPPRTLQASGGCIEVMTGAVLPHRCDAVVPVELVRVKDGLALVDPNSGVERGQSVHRRGSDHPAGRLIVERGRRLSGAEIGVAASAGKSELLVSRRPRIEVVGTGDELVAVETMPLAHQIRESNTYAIAAALRAWGFHDVGIRHVRDDRELLTAAITDVLENADVLILSGGVSMGRFDFVPEVLAAQGVHEIFHRVSQRPGKPLWFGTRSDGKTVFGLPGNPVSSLVCCRRFVIPALLQTLGESHDPRFPVTLGEDVRFAPPLTYFLPVKLSHDADARLRASPVRINGSGDYGALSGSDGFIELPRDENFFVEGKICEFHSWGPVG